MVQHVEVVSVGILPRAAEPLPGKAVEGPRRVLGADGRAAEGPAAPEGEVAAEPEPVGLLLRERDQLRPFRPEPLDPRLGIPHPGGPEPGELDAAEAVATGARRADRGCLRAGTAPRATTSACRAWSSRGSTATEVGFPVEHRLGIDHRDQPAAAIGIGPTQQTRQESGHHHHEHILINILVNINV